MVPNLKSGGAERVMSFVAKNISKECFDIALWVAGFEKHTQYNVEGLKVNYYNKSRVLTAISGLFNGLRKDRPDVVISSIAHLNTVMGFLSIFNPNTKFIGREANVLSLKKLFGSGKKRFYNVTPLTKLSYKLLDIILCQSKDMYMDMKLNYRVSERKLRIINNPITDDFKLKPEKLDKKEIINFITVARLKKQKGHERIIYALSKLGLPFRYTVVGDGPEKESLFDLITKLNLRDKIKHVPFTNEVSKYLANSDFFLQVSYVEGFPNCLIESCSIGTPIIAFRVPGGLDEIIIDDVNGFIAENEEEYIDSIIKVTSNRKWEPKTISDPVHRKFNKEIILQKYEELFLEL